MIEGNMVPEKRTLGQSPEACPLKRVSCDTSTAISYIDEEKNVMSTWFLVTSHYLPTTFSQKMPSQECTHTEIIGGVTPSIVIQLDELLVSKFLLMLNVGNGGCWDDY